MLEVDQRTIRKYVATGRLMACITSTRRRSYRIEDVAKMREGR